ncbi:MAG: CNNM domain-containing protein, partial [Cyclobacteriaceae bacterium]
MDEDPSYLYQLFLLTPTVSIGFLSFSILLTLFLLFLSAMISGSEVAFFSFSVEEIRECKDSNNEKERKIASLLENPKKLLATILIFNNLVNVAIVTFSTYALWHIFTPSELSGKLIAFASFVITFLIVFFGELIPKVYANNKRKEFALFTYNLLLVANKLFHGLSVLLINITTVVERRMKKEQYAVTVQDLQTAVEIVSTEETTEEEKEILKGIVNFGTISAKQIMCIRTDVTAFDYEINFHELMDKINKCNHSRIPVYRDTIDNIVGILYVKDLLPYIEDDENFNWQTLLRKTYFIPESKKIDALLNSFKERRVHLAIVVDE